MITVGPYQGLTCYRLSRWKHREIPLKGESKRKFQITSTKSQINLKHQIQSTKQYAILAFLNLRFVILNLFVICDLRFGIYPEEAFAFEGGW
jgi:hypothetical protein